MKKILSILTVLLSLACFGQSESKLKQIGSTLQEIIPSGWRVLDSTTGDLNHDGILDLVFAIQNTDTVNIELNDGLGYDTIDLNPRFLGIYFGTESGQFVQNSLLKEFIILRDSPTMDEPFEGLSISVKGVLEINFRFWYSAGSWTMSNHKYKFRFQKNDCVLIGYESNEAHRASGETTDYSINFLSQKMKITKGNFSNNTNESVEWKSFELDKPLTIKTLNKPFKLEFEGIYI